MIKKAILALLCGALAVFAFSPFNIWIFAFIAYGGLVLLINGLNAKRSACIAFCWAFGFFGAGVHWIYVSLQQYGDLPTPIAALMLCLLISYLSLYPMLFALLLQKLTKPYSFVQLVIAAPVLWQITEFLRGYILSGFSWLQLGYTQLNSPLKTYLAIFGVNFLNLLIPVLCGIIIYLCRSYKMFNRRQWYLCGSGILIFCLSTWLLSQITWTQTDTSRKTTVALIQGNIEQSLKWNKSRLNQTLADYKYLTEKMLPTADIIIWPEAAITDAEINQQNYLREIDWQARQFNASIALGIIDLRYTRQDYQVFNSLIILGDENPYQYPTENRYSKHHLVPFGEFIPLEFLLRPIAELLNIPMSSMSAGDAVQAPLMMQGFKFTTVICYEIILPQLVWNNFTPDTDFLLTVSNDAWFGDSIGPWQHLQMAQTRAIELGRPLIRSTNNGITAVVDQHGDIIKKLPQFEQAVLSIELSPTLGLTPYAIWGNYPYWILTFLLAMTFLIIRKKR